MACRAQDLATESVLLSGHSNFCGGSMIVCEFHTVHEMTPEIDADGDLVLQRRRPQATGHEEEDLVLSEVHQECLWPDATLTGAPSTCSTSHFRAMDGSELVRIQHAMATPLSRVGLQVWRGSLLLADYVLHQDTSLSLAGCTALELGAGPGLAGLALARQAAAVFLTDVGSEVLANTQQNAFINQQGIAAAVYVRELNWLEPPDWLAQEPGNRCTVLTREDRCGRAAQAPSSPSSGYDWQQADLVVLQQLDVVLAADCVYDDQLTEAFMRTAVLVMRHARQATGRPPRLLVALERRIVFTMTEMRAGAPAYDYWRSLFKEVEGPPQAQAAAAGTSAAAAAAAGAAAAVEAAAGVAAKPGRARAAGVPFPLVGWRLDVRMSIPQTIREATRSEYVELWELALV